MMNVEKYNLLTALFFLSTFFENYYSIFKMNIKRALISVSDKTGLIALAEGLHQLNIEILSTGGTRQFLQKAHIPVIEVAEITGFPEMMHGRVKTLHPKICGGILGERDIHAEIAKTHEIPWIDLVIVNLYPFAEVISKSNATFAEAIANIDIGGPTLIRAAAKNMAWVAVLTDPKDYETILQELNLTKTLSFDTRKKLAIKAFSYTAAYDAIISEYLSPHKKISFPETLTLPLKKHSDLRYGENPHQAAAAYHFLGTRARILFAKKYQGKDLSYNNVADANAALSCVCEYEEPACVIVKHEIPCGVAASNTILNAFYQAYHADAKSAYGGIVALNRTCDEETAASITSFFVEVVVAPSYTEGALHVLSKKKNLRVLAYNLQNIKESYDFKYIDGGMLVQEKDNKMITAADLCCMTKVSPSENDLSNLLFAWSVVRQVKSNAIVIAKNKVTLGIASGQVSRIDAVEIALKKAGEKARDAVLASDAFFPFADSIELIAASSIRAIIQPGGALRDQEIIAACDKHRIAMVFTGLRCFKH